MRRRWDWTPTLSSGPIGASAETGRRGVFLAPPEWSDRRNRQDQQYCRRSGAFGSYRRVKGRCPRLKYIDQASKSCQNRHDLFAASRDLCNTWRHPWMLYSGSKI
jgi:hypothetical protein